jgi:hypothetical protein
LNLKLNKKKWKKKLLNHLLGFEVGESSKKRNDRWFHEIEDDDSEFDDTKSDVDFDPSKEDEDEDDDVDSDLETEPETAPDTQP